MAFSYLSLESRGVVLAQNDVMVSSGMVNSRDAILGSIRPDSLEPTDDTSLFKAA